MFKVFQVRAERGNSVNISSNRCDGAERPRWRGFRGDCNEAVSKGSELLCTFVGMRFHDELYCHWETSEEYLLKDRVVIAGFVR